MLNIGCHLSVAMGFSTAAKQAIDIGANSFQFFTRNPRGGKAKALDLEDLAQLEVIIKENAFSILFAHGSYTMNMCSDKDEVRKYAKMIFADDIERLKKIPNAVYIFHPGSHVKQGAEIGIHYIIDAINEVVTEETGVTICLEGMSGKGTEIGRNFYELQEIIECVTFNESFGVCLDTCHLYSSGHDIVNDLDGVLDHIEDTIGLSRVKAIHLNDSKVPFDSNKDRHEKIGEGTIGLEAIIRIINHPRLKGMTFNLETPNDLSGYRAEIALLRERFEG